MDFGKLGVIFLFSGRIVGEHERLKESLSTWPNTLPVAGPGRVG